jgi:serine/threonine protein kinase
VRPRIAAKRPELVEESAVATKVAAQRWEGSERILHRDVKASNVMLDEDYNARLDDFVLAHVSQHDGTQHSTQAVAGARAYMDYESFFTGRASLDTYVYAFRVFAMGGRLYLFLRNHDTNPSAYIYAYTLISIKTSTHTVFL